MIIENQSLLDKRDLNLVQRLAELHGGARVAREHGGLHIYIASPVCLINDGKRELNKKHLSINIDRYFKRNQFRSQRGTYDSDLSGLCMKTGKPYRVSELLKLPPVECRNLPDIDEADTDIIIQEGREKYLVMDSVGNFNPRYPGDSVGVAGKAAGLCSGNSVPIPSVMNYPFKEGKHD